MKNWLNKIIDWLKSEWDGIKDEWEYLDIYTYMGW